MQKTLARSTSVSGRSLFFGKQVKLTFHPAPADHGISFTRSDLGDTVIPARSQYVVKRARRTSLRCADASVDTCEHVLSALAGMGIDNARLEIDGPEVPGFDGSSQPFVQAIGDAGLDELDQPRKPLKVVKPVVIEDGPTMIAAVPHGSDNMQVVFDLDYEQVPAIGRQLRVFDLSSEVYATQIAPARTFVLEQEAKALRASGIGAHLSPEQLLVVGETGPIAGNEFRFADEPVRHKILDLIGDLSLLGAPISGRIVAYRSGHAMNHRLVRALLDTYRQQSQQRMIQRDQAMDIRRLMRMMPHRYPMQLVDRVLEIDADRRAVGVKNVTINEPFFQGHYPGVPLMPGVLIVEAMAQLSGVLIGQTLEHTGKIPVLLSLDKVKLRRPVVPGDQLLMEAEAVRIRSRIAHMRCRSFVGDELAAEAQVKFMLVDDETNA